MGLEPTIMQRTEDGMVVISCDFCGSDWDEVKPMIEGHRGSVLCLNCLKTALVEMATGSQPYACTLCIREGLPPSLPRWQSPLRPQAVICEECIHQAAGAFNRDKDTDWSWQK